MPFTFEDLKQKISNAKNIAVIVDGRFDYDAVGSTVGVDYLLTQLNKPHECFYAGTMPANVTENLGFELAIKENIDFKSVNWSLYDLVIITDNSALDHLGVDYAVEFPKDLDVIRIDHHTNGVKYTDFEFFKMYASCCEIIFEIIETYNIPLTKDVATAVYAGILTDSGNFSYELVDSKTLARASRLLEYGFDRYSLYYKLFFKTDIRVVKYKGLVYSRFKISDIHRFSYSYCNLEDYENLGIDKSFDLVPGSDLIKGVTGVNFAVFIDEQFEKPGYYKLSFRSHERSYDVSALAKKLGGGGHRMAAGAKLTKPYASIDEILREVIAAL